MRRLIPCVLGEWPNEQALQSPSQIYNILGLDTQHWRSPVDTQTYGFNVFRGAFSISPHKLVQNWHAFGRRV